METRSLASGPRSQRARRPDEIIPVAAARRIVSNVNRRYIPWNIAAQAKAMDAGDVAVSCCKSFMDIFLPV